MALLAATALLGGAAVLLAGDLRARPTSAIVKLGHSAPEFEFLAAREAVGDEAGKKHEEQKDHESHKQHAKPETDDDKKPAPKSQKVPPDADLMWQTDQMKQSMQTQSSHANAELELETEQRKVIAKVAEKKKDKQQAEAKDKQEEDEKEDEEKEVEAHKKEAKEERTHDHHYTARSVLMAALEDLLGTPAAAPKAAAPKPKPLSQKVADGFHWLSHGSCSDAHLLPIMNKHFCEQAAEKLKLNDTSAEEITSHGRPEGCYYHDAKSLWINMKSYHSSHGSPSKSKDGHVRQQLCMTHAKKQDVHEWMEKQAEKRAREALEEKRKEEKEKKEEEKRKKEEEKEEKQEQALEKWDDDEKRLANVSLYCFSLMMPFGYEPGLLREQEKRKVGIYACNEAAVFSNTTVIISTGERSPVEVNLMKGSLAVAYGGKWMTALNTGVFNHLWMEVIRIGRYRYHDWVVKADPDAVFFPSRLRQLLRHKTPFNEEEVQRRVPEPKNLKCGNCQLKGKQEETCSSHVRFWQQKGHTCKAALKLVSREPPTDCGCDCDDFACDIPGSAMYLNNCKWGLHGPIEVLSRRGVAMYAAGLPQCVPLLENPWGEDKFLDQCMQQLGVTRINEYSLLSETACGEQPAPCGTSKVAFHPFKSIQSYFTCHEYANKYGGGPASRPRFDTEDDGIDVDDVMLKVEEHTA